MQTELDYKTVEQMTKFGGSFVQALAECFLHADPTNFRKLKTTFSEYWHTYEAMALEAGIHE